MTRTLTIVGVLAMLCLTGCRVGFEPATNTPVVGIGVGEGMEMTPQEEQAVRGAATTAAGAIGTAVGGPAGGAIGIGITEAVLGLLGIGGAAVGVRQATKAAKSEGRHEGWEENEVERAKRQAA